LELTQLDRIEARILDACERSDRVRDSVLLLPVSKTQSIDKINSLYDLGIRDFGENRVQELLKKKDELPEDVRWHFIGNLQTNKAKYLAPFIHTVHSIHSVELAGELSKRAAKQGRTINVLVEANISYEEQKHGADIQEIESIVTHVADRCQNLELVGLMGMASYEDDPEKTRPQFRKLRQLRDEIAERHKELISFKELSMGMSNDFEVAIEEGATIVRIGSALFGEQE
jgi:pyridoxal phosphate enzyme (YggS family)